MKRGLLSLIALLAFALGGIAQTTFTKVISDEGLVAGASYLIVAHHDNLGVLAMGMQKPNNRNAVEVDENGGTITVIPGTDPASETDVFPLTLGGSTGAWTLFDEVMGGYLYASSSSNNYLKTKASLDANGQWSISFNDDGTAEVVAQGESTHNSMRFNPNTQNNAPLFGCYAENSSVRTRVSFYKAGTDGLGDLQREDAARLYPNPASDQVWLLLDGEAQISVIDLKGCQVIGTKAAAGEVQLDLSGLECGTYFVNIRYANGRATVTKLIKR